jgi:hypothetical protein
MLSALVDTHRERSAAKTASVLSGIHALSQRPSHELAAIAATSAASAWAAWTTAPRTVPQPPRTAAKSGNDGKHDGKHDHKDGGQSGQGGVEKGVSTFAWLSDVAVAGYAAANAASATLSKAADIAHALNPARALRYASLHLPLQPVATHMRMWRVR